MELKGTVSLVTGGGTRVGRAISKALAGEGSAIAIHYRNSSIEAESTAGEIRSDGGKAECFRADLTVAEDVDHLVPKVIEHLGRLDVLVNSASVYRSVPMAETDMAEWNDNMMVHAWAPFRLSQIMLAELEDRPGKIVNIVDVHMVRQRRFAYGVSKATLSAITRSLAASAGPNVQVNELALGAILPPPDWDDERIHRMAERIPAKRWGTPEPVALAVVSLMKNDYINAETIRVDGGETGTRQ